MQEFLVRYINTYGDECSRIVTADDKRAAARSAKDQDPDFKTLVSVTPVGEDTPEPDRIDLFGG